MFLLLVAPNTAQAKTNQTKIPPRGVTLSPALVNLNLQASESQHELDFILTNNESAPQTVNLSTRDFNTLNESGGLFFVGTNPTQLQKKYGLATWLSLPKISYTLSPKQSLTITAFVVNQPSMSSGGHYGALMVNLEPNGSSGLSQNKVSLQPIASALLFVNKVGGELHHLKLTNVYYSHSLWKLPSQVTLRFQNTGNTHLVPRGVVDIYGPGAKHVSHGVLNESSGIILPETARRYSVGLKNVSPTSAPGKYKLIVNWRFDGYEQYRTYQSRLWFVTPLNILILILVVIGISLTMKRHPIKAFRIRFMDR